MISGSSLPPHLTEFIREQLAAGRFHSEDEVIRDALQRLRAATPTDRPFDLSRLPERTALTERWETPAEWLAASAAGDRPPAPERRSPRGLLADLRRGLNVDDIQSARREMWAGFRHGET